MVCPLVSADDLHHAWPEAEYIVVPDAGHSALEPSIRSLLIEAMERFTRGEPLRRIHECVFGVLALESEPVDPRL